MRRSYKTFGMSRVLDGIDAERTMSGPVVNELAGLAGFAFGGTVSPGPNNTVLWASGMRFGFRRSIPHVLGTALGLAVGVAAGVGALLEAMPAAKLALKVVGSLYLLYVAVLVVRGGDVKHADVSHPLSLGQGAAFQFANPKAWIFAIAAVGTFLSPALPWPVGVALLTGTLMVIVIASSSIWAAGGAALGRVVENERARRAVSIALAVLLGASVALIWV
jgi:threonine/homoserine/homoserine lactone efflux protein